MADERIAVERIRVTPTISATITDVYFIELLNGWYLANVKEHAPPLAGASVETGVEVHVTGDVDD